MTPEQNDTHNAYMHLQACIEGAPRIEAFTLDAGTKNERTDWESYLQASRDNRRNVNEARAYLLRVQGLASADGAFEGCPAPSGAGEHVGTVEHRAARDTGYGTVPRNVRRIERHARIAGRRRAVLATARRIEASRRARNVELARLALPAVEWVPAVPSTAPRPLTAWDAIEERHADIERTRRASAALMASRPNRDGRGTVDAAPNSVNGTEVRNARRWQGTTRSTYRTAVTNEDGTVTLTPVDWQCYRVTPSGERVPFTPSTKSTKRTRKTRKASSVVKLNALAGVLGVEAQG